MTSSLLTVDDLAAMLGMTRDWVYAEVRAGRIPHAKLGRYVRFRADTIERWISDLEAESIAPSTRTLRRRGHALGHTTEGADSHAQRA